MIRQASAAAFRPALRSAVRTAGGGFDVLSGYALSEVDFAAPEYQVYAAAHALGCKPIHPAIVRFPVAWNGYRYWCAYTPFSAASPVQHENPCVCASLDGKVWEDPAGLTNPLDDYPGTGEWNSDTYLLFADGLLQVFWRHQLGDERENLWRRTSADGITWSAAELCWDNPTGTAAMPTGYGAASPNILPHPNGGWQLWGVTYNRGTPHTLRRWTAPTLTGPWTGATLCSVAGMTDSETVWHMTIRRIGGKYIMLGSIISLGGGTYFFESSNGIDWTRAATPLLTQVRIGTAGQGLGYKCEFLPDGAGSSPEFQIIMASAKNWNMARAARFPTSAKILADAVALRGDYLAGDDFIRSNAAVPGSTTSGSAWQLASGSAFNISSNRLIANAYANNRMVVNAGAANVRVGIRFAAVQGGNDGCYVMARANSDLSKFFRFGRNGSGLLALEKIDGGVVSIVATNLPIPTAGSWLSLECVGDSLSIYQDNTKFGTWTDSFQNTATRHGIQSAEIATAIDGFFVSSSNP